MPMHGYSAALIGLQPAAGSSNYERVPAGQPIWLRCFAKLSSAKRPRIAGKPRGRADASGDEVLHSEGSRSRSNGTPAAEFCAECWNLGTRAADPLCGRPEGKLTRLASRGSSVCAGGRSRVSCAPRRSSRPRMATRGCRARICRLGASAERERKNFHRLLYSGVVLRPPRYDRASAVAMSAVSLVVVILCGRTVGACSIATGFHLAARLPESSPFLPVVPPIEDPSSDGESTSVARPL